MRAILFTDKSTSYITEYGEDVFGTGSDGDLVINSGQTVSLSNNIGSEDCGLVYKQYNSITINANGLLQCSQRNAGMILRVKHNVTINGTITNIKSSRSLTDAQIDNLHFAYYYPSFFLSTKASSGDKGGTASSYFSAVGGDGQLGRFYGGGYSGGGSGGHGWWGSSSSNDSGVSGGNGGSAANMSTSTGFFVGASYPPVNVSSKRQWGNDGSYGGGGSGGCCPTNYKDPDGNYYHSGAGGSGAGGAGGTGIGYETGKYTVRDCGGGGGAGNIGGGVIIIYCGGTFTLGGTLNVAGNAGGAGGGVRNVGSDTLGSSCKGAAGGTAGGGKACVIAQTFVTAQSTVQSRMNCSPIKDVATSDVKRTYTLKEYFALVRDQ